MANYESARPFPVLGRTGDYKDASFEKSMSLSADGFSVEISNVPNLVNTLAGSSVGDFLLIENRSTATKLFIPLEGNIVVVPVPADQLWGLTSLTILQISLEPFSLVDENQDQFDDFFKGETKTEFDVREGEVVGVGESQHLNIGGSSGSSWIQFDRNEASSFDYRVSSGVSGNIVVHLGNELFEATMMAMSSPETRNWATLSLAKPGVEFAIQSALSETSEEFDERPEWFEGLIFRLSELGITDADDIKDLTELQRVSMQILENEVLVPLTELIRESQSEER